MLNSCEYFNSREHIPWRAFDVPLLYYPGGLQDIEPLDLILGDESLSYAFNPSDSCRGDSRFQKDVLRPAFSQAIYADYSINDQMLDLFIRSIRRRYGAADAIFQELLPEHFNKNLEDFFPLSKDPFYKTQAAHNWTRLDMHDPRKERDYFFGRRITFNSIGFSLIYLRTEAIQTYRILQSMKIIPNIIAFYDHSFGGEWTEFGGDSLLNKAARVKPRYLYCGDNSDPWPKYCKVAESRLRYVDPMFIRSLFKRD